MINVIKIFAKETRHTIYKTTFCYLPDHFSE